MADDTKKVLFPKDKSQDGNLDNDFTAQDADYAALPDVARSGQDDLPVDPQQPVDNVEAVSISSARRKVLNDTRLNPRQPDDSSIASSSDQFVTESQKADTLNRPSRTVTLGQFLKKGAPGRRISQADTTGVDSEGNPIRQRLGGDILKDVRTEPLGRRAETPHGRSVAGSPGEAYGEINVQPGSGDVVRKTVSAVLSQNRFSALDNKVYAADNAQTNPDEKVVSSFQPEVGAYNPNASSVQGAQEGRSYTLDDLKSIGAQMLAQSAGFSREDTSPRTTNLGLRDGSERINVNELRPRNLTSVPIGSEDFSASKASTGQFDEPDNGEPVKTFGQLSTPNAFFDGLLPGEMKKLADSVIALTIEAVSGDAGGTDLLSLMSRQAIVDRSLESAPYDKGRFVDKNTTRKRSGALRTDLGFTYTANDFQKSVDAGVALMFGQDPTDLDSSPDGQKINLESNMSAAKENIASNPGFYVNFCRAVLRDAENLAEIFRDINPEIAKGTNRGVAGAFTMIEAFRSSKLVAGLNVLATTGDAVLTRGQSPYNVDQLASSGDFAFAPFGIPLDGGFFHYRPISHAMKSRDGQSVNGESPESIRLAWRNSSVPSMYLLPTEMEFGSILNVANTVSNDSPVAGHVAMEGITKASSEGRLAQEFVENTERILDAEYVPFYFHDLRTGEIIAFHAFLNDLSDGFNAQFSTNTVIGRTEPIRTYSNTSRDIGFSFYVAATSKEDFDEMWFKINKLVTMLYPQYTQGRSTDERIAADGTGLFGLGSFSIRPKFIMPFSQVQSASPMIRLRIGDVIKTNYSKFNLSRLFGLGTEEFSAFPGAADFNKITLEVLRYVFEGLDRLAALGAKNKSKGAQAAASFTRSSGLSSVNALEFLRLGRQKAKLKPTMGESNTGAFSRGLGIGDVVRLSYPSVRYLYKASGTGPEKLHLPFADVFAKVLSAPRFDDKGNASYEVKLSSSSALARLSVFDVSGDAAGAYYMNHHDATLIPHGLLAEMLVINGIRLVTGVSAAIFGGLLQGGAFLNNTNNAIARSFDQTSGKGLPGYISRMSFNWINNDTTWETSKGSKAPKIARIQCQFQPVHDIAPGLDHLGYNRAPVYQVGDVVNEIVGKSGDLLDSDLAELAADAVSVVRGGGINRDIQNMKLDDD